MFKSKNLITHYALAVFYKRCCNLICYRLLYIFFCVSIVDEITNLAETIQYEELSEIKPNTRITFYRYYYLVESRKLDEKDELFQHVTIDSISLFKMSEIVQKHTYDQLMKSNEREVATGSPDRDPQQTQHNHQTANSLEMDLSPYRLQVIMELIGQKMSMFQTLCLSEYIGLEVNLRFIKA